MLGRRDAELRLLGQARTHDIVQSGRNRGIGARRGLRSGRQDLVADRWDGIAVKWVETGQHFMENYAEGKEIGTSVLCAAENLFGAPVSRSTANGGIGLMAGEAGHAEVRKFDAIFRSEEDVGGFEVAVNARAAVREGESDGNVTSPFASRGIGNTALGDDFFQ